MKCWFTFIALAMFVSGPAFAQAPAQQKTPPHQPGVSSPATNPQAQENSPPPALEKPDPAKEAAVRHLMEVTETNKLGDNIVAAITAQVHQVMGRVIKPEQLQMFMDQFTQKFKSGAPSAAVTDAIVPVYARHFTLEQIQGLIHFYESPLGKTVVKEMPQITQESEATGIQIDQKAAIAVLQSMQDQYPELKQMLPPPGGAPSGAGPGPGAGAESAPGQRPAPAAPSAPPQK
jgi:uncharacterized protein